MDSLLSTLKKKKKERSRYKKKVTGGKRKRYIRQSEFEKIQEKEYYDSLRKEEEERIKKKRKVDHIRFFPSKINKDNNISAIPPRENVMLSLREVGEPITLYGESDLERFKRLRYVQTNEVTEDRTNENPNEGMQLVDLLSEHEESKEKLFLTEEEEKMSQERLNILRSTHENKALPKFNTTEGNKLQYCVQILERLIRDWEAWLILSPELMKKSLEFRRDREIHIQCKQYIQPLFKKLRKNQLSDDILDPLFNILSGVVKGKYIQANIEFMKLSIGNSPWPMGVTNVGIHARSANEKIKVDTIAHVLNDETQRKYIQSVKRLMTFAKRKYSRKRF